MSTTSLTGVEVRDAGRSDLPRARRVLLAAYQEYATAMPPAVFGSYLAELLDVEARAGTGRILVAEVGGRVVGTVTYYPDAAVEGLGWPAGWAGLRALGVEPAARGRGVGRALVEACRRRAEAGGADVLCLHTDQFMTAALAIYGAMGFRRAPAFDFDATSRFALAGVRPVPVLGYRLDLSRQHEEHAMDTAAIRVGALYENPVTGERAVVRVPPQEANGHLLVVDLYLRPGGRVAGEHVHPVTTESFTVVEGQLAVRHDGRSLDAGPGTRVQVAPGVAHDFWNASGEEVRVLVEVQPGERLEQLIRQLFLSAQDGRTDAKGRPRPLLAAVLAREFADTMRFTSPPQLVQRALFGLLAPVARATGHRALDPEYLRRELPVVDLEPLPAEIAAAVPASQPLDPTASRHFAVDPDPGAGGPDADEVAAGAAALGPPDVGVAGEAGVAEVVDAEAVDPDLDRGRAGQVEVDQAGRELQVDRDLGGRVAEADGQAGHARLDLDPAQVERAQVEVGGDGPGGDVELPGQRGVQLDAPVVAAVAGQHPPLRR